VEAIRVPGDDGPYRPGPHVVHEAAVLRADLARVGGDVVVYVDTRNVPLNGEALGVERQREIGSTIAANADELLAGTEERLTAERVQAADLARTVQETAHRVAALEAVAAWVLDPKAKYRAGRTAAILQRLDASVSNVRDGHD
jgi:hypothetical protein